MLVFSFRSCCLTLFFFFGEAFFCCVPCFAVMEGEGRERRMYVSVSVSSSLLTVHDGNLRLCYDPLVPPKRRAAGALIP